MMLDWAVSILLVSLIVFGLVVISLDFFQNVDHDYVLRNALSNSAFTVSDEVDRTEAIPADINQGFFYNETVSTSGSSEYGVPMPSSLAGSTYSVDFTHDFVVLVSSSGGPVVGTYEDLTEPVVLIPENMTHQWENQPYNGYYLTSYHLHVEDAMWNCWSFPSGVNFNVTVANVLVDGEPTYLAFIYAMNGMSPAATPSAAVPYSC